MSAAAAVPQLKQLTPVLVVDSVEPCLAFWTERFAFTAENQVPGPDGKLIFASAKKGGIEVMYETRKAAVADNVITAKELDGRSCVLFIAVESLDQVERALAGVPVLKARHKTSYGSLEVYVREPGGHVVGFAQFA
ncbi:MAG TPA: VOC family protein [Gemmatimonadales bacterium]|nr:VOC family protein [Gemmatimonadales bacterium]